MSDLVDAIAQKLHLRKSSKCDGSSPSSSEEEVGDAADVDDVAATLTNDFGVNFECVSAQCQYNDTKLIPPGTKKMEYKSRQWHEKCFACLVCKTAIGTKSFIPREQDIYCSGCYEEKFATRCVKCIKIITTGGVTYKNDPWHRECFTCTHCDKSLAGQRFTSKDEKPYCAECFGELFAKRCTACIKPITGIGGTRFISFEDRHWHNDCFQCATCNATLVGKGFITDGADILCPECAKARVL